MVELFIAFSIGLVGGAGLGAWIAYRLISKATETVEDDWLGI